MRGQWVTDDFLCRLIKGCIQLKASPFVPTGSEYTPSVDMAPVDYVASAIVRCVLTPGNTNKGYNVCNPHYPYPFLRMFEKIRSFGYELETLPYNQWRERLYQSMEADPGSKAANALIPIANQFSEVFFLYFSLSLLTLGKTMGLGSVCVYLYLTHESVLGVD